MQYVLDAAGSMTSSATFLGILLWAVSGCCYNNGGLRNRRWANAIMKHGGKGEWQTSVQSLPLGELRNLVSAQIRIKSSWGWLKEVPTSAAMRTLAGAIRQEPSSTGGSAPKMPAPNSIATTPQFLAGSGIRDGFGRF